MKSLAPIFTGHVNDRGELHIDDNRRFVDAVKALACKRVEVSIRRQRTRRSVDQNAYWHAVPFPMFAEEWGVPIEDAKLLLLGECFGWHEVRGHRLPVKPHSSLLTTEEGALFTEWMVQWGITEWHMTIPLPREVEVA